MRLRHLQFYILVPSSPNDFLVSGTERTQTTQEDRFLGSYNPVQPRHRRSKQSGCLPILERDSQRTSPIDRSDPADDYVIGQIEENECGPELAGRAGSEGNWQMKTSPNIFSAGNRTPNPQAGLHEGTVHKLRHAIRPRLNHQSSVR